MKKLNCNIIIIIFLINSCFSQEKDYGVNDSLKIISEKKFLFGKSTFFTNYKRALDGNYLLKLKIRLDSGSYKETQYGIDYFMKISHKGNFLYKKPISIKYMLTDYVEFGTFYFVVSTNRRTMGGPTEDYLSKYDNNWNLIWTKKIGKEKYPEGRTVITVTKKNELLLISDEYKRKDRKQGISIRVYTLEGYLKSQNFIQNMDFSNPMSLLKTDSDKYLLTSQSLDQKKNVNNLWLIKLDSKGDTLWTKIFPEFYVSETIMTKSKDFIIYGFNYNDEHNRNYIYIKILKVNRFGELIWEKEIKQNYRENPGNIVTLNSGDFLFSSSIVPNRNDEARPYLFILNKKGDFVYGREFYHKDDIVGVPFLTYNEKDLTMIYTKLQDRSISFWDAEINIAKVK